MANSRLEKIGTIFTRTTGLLRSGAMKPEDKPIWYDVYAAFPPKLEPRYDRPAPNVTIRKIFYAEDQTRAQYAKLNKNTTSVNLVDGRNKTHSQLFIECYNKLKAEGALSEDKIIETTQDLLQEKIQQDKSTRISPNLTANFTDAQKTTSKNINITDIFKE